MPGMTGLPGRQAHTSGHRNSHSTRHPSASGGRSKHASKRTSKYESKRSRNSHHSHSHSHSHSHQSRSHHSHSRHHHHRRERIGGGTTEYKEVQQKGRTADLVILLLLGLSSLIFLAVGIWLLADRLGWPFGLNFARSSDWTRFLSIGLLIFITGLILLILTVIGFVAYSGGKTVARACTIFLAALAFLLLLTIFLISVIMAASTAGWLTDWWRNGWKKTRDIDPSRLCRFQRDHKCYGFEDNDCANCDVTASGVYTSGCTARQKELCPACVSGNSANSASRFLGVSPKADASILFQSPSDVDLSKQVVAANPSRRSVAFVAEAKAPKNRLRLRGVLRTKRGPVVDPDRRPEPSSSPNPSPIARPSPSPAGSTGGGGVTGGGITGGNGGNGRAGGAGLFTQFTGNGCKDAIRNEFREFMIPWAVFSLFLMILVFLQFFFLCCVVKS